MGRGKIALSMNTSPGSFTTANIRDRTAERAGPIGYGSTAPKEGDQMSIERSQSYDVRELSMEERIIKPSLFAYLTEMEWSQWVPCACRLSRSWDPTFYFIFFIKRTLGNLWYPPISLRNQQEDWEEIEKKIGCCQVEELIEEAQDELRLITKLAGTFLVLSRFINADYLIQQQC
ncbi:putative NADH dehydrogenase [Carex littledalei]|uniref:Putative NADH dehydrogenase n=1 Tax=Carex littledalei TaxID=544730 RepID=A0A833VBQ9_9POAL|nr:putative NADH dehydrogenase [Carex littledalei]